MNETWEISANPEMPDSMISSFSYYMNARLSDVVFSVTNPHPKYLSLQSVIFSDASGELSKEIFRKICERNPKIAKRYDGWRLLSQSYSQNGRPAFELLDKASWAVLHVYHDDGNGEWVRDAYELDASWEASFHSYVTKRKDALFEADLDLAIANGRGSEPSMDEYAGSIPPLVYDPFLKIWAVRSIVRRIVDSAVL